MLAAFPAFMEIEDVSPDGRVLIAAGSLRYSVHGSPSVGQRERDLSVFDATRVVQLSASGTELLFLDDSTGTQAGGSQGGFVFIRPMDGSPPVTLGAGRPIAMTSDGEAVAILGDGAARIATSDVITLVPRGAGSPRTIRLPIQMQYSDRNAIGINAWELHTAEFSDDDQRLLIPFGWEEGAAPRVWVHDFGEERTRPITPEGVTGPVVMSPDGRFVASNETEGLFVYPVDGGDRREVPGGPDVGKLARWSSNREVVYVLEQDGTSARVFQRDIVTGEREFREVRAPDPAGVTRFDLRISRDGEAYAYSLDRWLTNLFLIENVG